MTWRIFLTLTLLQFGGNILILNCALSCLGITDNSWSQTQHVNGASHGIKDNVCLATGTTFFLGWESANNTQCFCQWSFVTRAMWSPSLAHPCIISLWNPSFMNLYLTFSRTVFEPNLSLGNRNPLKNPFFCFTWLKRLPCSSNGVRRIINSIQPEALTCNFRNLSSVIKWW